MSLTGYEVKAMCLTLMFGPLSGNERLFGHLVRLRLPVRHAQVELLPEAGDILRERLAALVVVALLEGELPVDLVLGRVLAAEDVHRARIPPVERGLQLVV